MELYKNIEKPYSLKTTLIQIPDHALNVFSGSISEQNAFIAKGINEEVRKNFE